MITQPLQVAFLLCDWFTNFIQRATGSNLLHNQIDKTKFVPFGTKPTLLSQKCLICKELDTPNQIILIKLTKRNPPKQFYQTRAK